MKNFLRTLFFGIIFTGMLSACQTTYDAPKFTSTASSDVPAQAAAIKKRSSFHLQLAVSYFQQAQYATALKELNTTLSIDPVNSDAYGIRALVYMQMEDSKAAEQDFQRALSLAPNSPDNINNYGWFLCQSGKEKQAMDMFEQVMKDRTYTQPVKALDNAGMCSLKMKDDQLAEAYFLQAIRLDANNPIANVNLSRIAYKRQDWIRSQFYVNRLIKVEVYTPEILWLAIKSSHKLNDVIVESSLIVQLRRRFPESEEYALFQRGAFDE